jgi:hypothetical protein
MPAEAPVTRTHPDAGVTPLTLPLGCRDKHALPAQNAKSGAKIAGRRRRAMILFNKNDPRQLRGESGLQPICSAGAPTGPVLGEPAL